MGVFPRDIKKGSKTSNFYIKFTLKFYRLNSIEPKDRTNLIADFVDAN